MTSPLYVVYGQSLSCEYASRNLLPSRAKYLWLLQVDRVAGARVQSHSCACGRPGHVPGDGGELRVKLAGDQQHGHMQCRTVGHAATGCTPVPNPRRLWPARWPDCCKRWLRNASRLSAGRPGWQTAAASPSDSTNAGTPSCSMLAASASSLARRRSLRQGRPDPARRSPGPARASTPDKGQVQRHAPAHRVAQEHGSPCSLQAPAARQDILLAALHRVALRISRRIGMAMPEQINRDDAQTSGSQRIQVASPAAALPVKPCSRPAAAGPLLAPLRCSTPSRIPLTCTEHVPHAQFHRSAIAFALERLADHLPQLAMHCDVLARSVRHLDHMQAAALHSPGSHGVAELLPARRLLIAGRRTSPRRAKIQASGRAEKLLKMLWIGGLRQEGENAPAVVVQQHDGSVQAMQLAASSPLRSWKNERSPMTSTSWHLSAPALAPSALETTPSIPLAPRLARMRTRCSLAGKKVSRSRTGILLPT